MKYLFHHNVLQQVLSISRESVYCPSKRQESHGLLMLYACNNPVEIMMIMIMIIINLKY
jgi:hypothetical protein